MGSGCEICRAFGLLDAPERSRTSTSLFSSQGPQPCCWRSCEVLLGSIEPFQVGSVRSVSLNLGPRMGPRVRPRLLARGGTRTVPAAGRILEACAAGSVPTVLRVSPTDVIATATGPDERRAELGAGT